MIQSGLQNTWKCIVLNETERSLRRFENGEPLKNLMTPSDAVTGQKAAGGWARMMNSGLTKEQIAAMPLEKYLGKRGWTDPSEWM